jgi:hypothetical protein
MGADQHPFQETMRIGVEVILILERTRLALIAVDGHQTGARLAAHRSPFAACRESGTTEAAQPAIIQCLENRFDAEFAGTQTF